MTFHQRVQSCKNIFFCGTNCTRYFSMSLRSVRSPNRDYDAFSDFSITPTQPPPPPPPPGDCPVFLFSCRFAVTVLAKVHRVRPRIGAKTIKYTFLRCNDKKIIHHYSSTLYCRRLLATARKFIIKRTIIIIVHGVVKPRTSTFDCIPALLRCHLYYEQHCYRAIIGYYECSKCNFRYFIIVPIIMTQKYNIFTKQIAFSFAKRL